MTRFHKLRSFGEVFRGNWKKVDPNGRRRAQENTVYINVNNVKVEIARREQKPSFIRKLCNNRELLNKLSNERMEQDEKT